MIKEARIDSATSATGEVAVTPALGSWVAGLKMDDLPAEVIGHIKLCILDSLGCGVYGATQPWGRITADVALELSPNGGSTLFGRQARVGAGDAAMANGTAIHGFEIDDLHVAGMCHPGSVTISAALAVSEADGTTGSDFLTATVAGYETGIRVGLCAGLSHSVAGYHGAATVGSICAGAAVARALNLNADQATHALGIAGTQAAGLYSARKGAMTKRFHAGRAAQSGVFAGMLAHRGFTGSREVLEASFGGFMSTMQGQSDPRTILQELGTRWETSRVGFKAYAACGSTHTTVDALDELMGKGLTADNLVSLTVRMTKKAMTNVGWPYRPDGVVSAQMNGHYTAAVKLLHGDAFIDQYRESMLADDKILELIGRIKLVHDPNLDQGGAAMRHWIKVEARLADGRILNTEKQYRRGSAEHPLSGAEVEQKFRRLTATSLSDEAVDGIVDFVGTLERQQSLRPLGDMLRRR